MWAGRILESDIATQSLRDGLATQEELEEISAAWHRWTENADGWISMRHGKILAIT